jgi:hypothetical protein
MYQPKVMVNAKKPIIYLVEFPDDHSRMSTFSGFFFLETWDSVFDSTPELNQILDQNCNGQVKTDKN